MSVSKNETVYSATKFLCNDTRSKTSLNFSVIHGTDQPDQPEDVANGNFAREMLINNFTSDLLSKAEIHCIFESICID